MLLGQEQRRSSYGE